MKNLLSSKQIDISYLWDIFKTADMFKNGGSSDIGRGRVLGLIKDSPSTRTRVSTEIAMKRLGGEVVVLDLDEKSSIAKGESYEDTIKIMSDSCDILAMRLDKASYLSCFSSCPVINLGCNKEHPTQSLLDVYTMHKKWHGFSDKRVLMLGDLLCSRTIHSLIYLLGLLKVQVDITLLCNNLPDDCWNYVRENKLNVNIISSDLSGALGKKHNAIYLTRWQKERHNIGCPSNYPRLTSELLSLLREDCLIMHPLPRGEELPVEIDTDKRSIYFEQALNGVYIRMAILRKMLGDL